MEAKILHPLGVELNRLPQTQQEWQSIPDLMMQKVAKGVLVINDLDLANGVQLEVVLQQFAAVLGHRLLPYDQWPGQSPGVANCAHLALLGNYKARFDNDIIVGGPTNSSTNGGDGGGGSNNATTTTTTTTTVRQGDAIAEYKPATLDISEWHTDGSFLERPKSYIALYAPLNVPHALPPQGGETRFCSTKVKDGGNNRRHPPKYTGWTSVHSWETFMQFLQDRDPSRPKVTQADIDQKPDQTWPLVMQRHDKGSDGDNWYYYLNPKNTKAVYNADGLAVDHPTQFIHDLAQEILDHNGVYWHQWKPGQLVIWDNLTTMHAATPFDATQYERLLYRAEFGPHYIPSNVSTVHWGYLDPTVPPVATLPLSGGDDGASVVVVVDTVNGSILPPSSPSSLAQPQQQPHSFTKVPRELWDIHEQVTDRVGPHILTGPIAVQGAEPGHVLQIDILNVRLRSDWAYTLHVKSGQYRHTKLLPTGGGGGEGVALTEWGSRLDLHPFFGVLGVAKGQRVSSIPPSTLYGGNLDLRRLVAGSTLYIPIHEKDALLYIGDGHARQGDGECCGTALETSLTGTFRITVRKDMPLVGVRAETRDEMIGIGIESTVDAAVDSALSDMVRWMQQERPALSTVDAECLLSVAGDIAVTQVVNGATRGAHVVMQKAHLPPPSSSSLPLA